jgi:hypothetical protein
MFGYCLALAVWSAAMLCISGLDVTIGHYDFKETSYYSLATSPTNLIISKIRFDRIIGKIGSNPHLAGSSLLG